MVIRGAAVLTTTVLVVGLAAGCGGGSGSSASGTDPASGLSPSSPSSPSSSVSAPAPTSPTSSPSLALPTGITITAKFGGGLGHASITVPKGWKAAAGFANVQATADNASGSQSVDLILAPGASHFTVEEQARAQARTYRGDTGKPATIHPPFESNGLRFAYVTGASPDGYDSTTFARNVPLPEGGFGGISVSFEFEPSTPQPVRQALYGPILASLTYG